MWPPSYEKHASHTDLSNKELDAGSSAAWTVAEQLTFSQHWWSCSTQSERWNCSIQLIREVELKHMIREVELQHTIRDVEPAMHIGTSCDLGGW